jgi:hypothetical protein
LLVDNCFGEVKSLFFVIAMSGKTKQSLPIVITAMP